MIDNRNNCPECNSPDSAVYEGERVEGAYKEKV